MARKEHLLADLGVDKLYGIQVRSVGPDGKKSAWSPKYSLRTVADSIPPSPPTNLEWADFGVEFVATWEPPTTNEDGTVLNDLADYLVTVTGNGQTAEYVTSSERFDFTYEMNVAAFGSAATTVLFSVRARDRNGNISTALTMEADTVPPATPTGVYLSTGIETLYIGWDHNTESDLDGYKVYVSTDAAVPLEPTNLVWSGRGNYISIPVDESVNYYVRVSAFDRYGNESGPSDVASIAGKVTDTEAPVTPTNLGLAVNSYISGQTLLGRIVATWDANTESDLDGYYIRIHKLDSGDYSTYRVDKSLALYEFTALLPNTEYGVAVAAVDKTNNISYYSEEVTATTNGDATAPATPVMFTPVVGPTSIDFFWSESTASDFKEFILEIATDINFTQNLQTIVTSATRYVFSGNPNTTYFARVSAADRHGNVSSPSTPPRSTAPGQVQSTYIASLEVSKLLSGQITAAEIELTSGAKIFSGTAWSLDANELYMAAGRITLGQGGFSADNTGRFYAGGTTFDNAKWRTDQYGNMRVGGAEKFHVNASGDIWSGSDDKATAPWYINGDGGGQFGNVSITGENLPDNSDVINAGNRFIVKKLTGGVYEVRLKGNMWIDAGGKLTLGGGNIEMTSGDMKLNGGSLSLQSGAVLFNGAPVTINNSILTLTENGQLRAGSPGPLSSGLSLDVFGLRIWKSTSATPVVELLSTGNAFFRGTVEGAIVKGSTVSGSIFTTANNPTTSAPTGTGPRVVMQTGYEGITFYNYSSVDGTLKSSTIRQGNDDGIEINGSLRVGPEGGTLRTLYANVGKFDAAVQVKDSKGNFTNLSLDGHTHNYATSTHQHTSLNNDFEIQNGNQLRLHGVSDSVTIEVALQAWMGSDTGIINADFDNSNRQEVRVLNYAGTAGRGISANYFRVASTEAIKANIEDAPSMLSRLKQVKIKNYNMAEDVDDIKKLRSTKAQNQAQARLRKYTGFIVEQLRETFPELVLGDGVLVNDALATLWKITQEQQEQIERLESDIKALKK